LGEVARIFCAVYCGMIVNPDAIVAQMESAITFGLSAALYGAITLKNSRVEQFNFDISPMMRINVMPEVWVAIIQSGERPSAIGETVVPPIAPKVANALFAVNGARLRSLTLTLKNILEELKVK